MNTLLVTGASGYIGQHTVPCLTKDTFMVKTVDHKTTDLLNYQQTRNRIQEVNPSHLLHFAWDVSPGYLLSPNNHLWVNASLSMLEQFIECGGIRAVFAGSSFDVYARTTTVYGACKAELYERASEMCKDYGVSFVWGRVFQVYGAGEQPGRLIPYVINSLLHNTLASCTSGVQVRDFVYVLDVGKAFAALCSGTRTGQFDIGTGTGIPVRDVVSEIARQLGKDELIRFGKIVKGGTDPAYVVANRCDHDRIGWHPTVTLEDGIAKSIEYWRHNEPAC